MRPPRPRSCGAGTSVDVTVPTGQAVPGTAHRSSGRPSFDANEVRARPAPLHADRPLRVDVPRRGTDPQRQRRVAHHPGRRAGSGRHPRPPRHVEQPVPPCSTEFDHHGSCAPVDESQGFPRRIIHQHRQLRGQNTADHRGRPEIRRIAFLPRVAVRWAVRDGARPLEARGLAPGRWSGPPPLARTPPSPRERPPPVRWLPAPVPGRAHGPQGALRRRGPGSRDGFRGPSIPLPVRRPLRRAVRCRASQASRRRPAALCRRGTSRSPSVRKYPAAVRYPRSHACARHTKPLMLQLPSAGIFRPSSSTTSAFMPRMDVKADMALVRRNRPQNAGEFLPLQSLSPSAGFIRLS